MTPASPGRARRRRWGALTVFALAGCNGPAAVRDAGTGEAGSMEGGMDEGTDGDLPPEMTSLPMVTPLTETLIRLTWEAGSDDVTAAAELSYHVYRAKSADGLDFTVAPSLVVPKGVTTADVVGLSPTQENFFVVRAVDGAGQESENTAPVSGQTPDLTAPDHLHSQSKGVVAGHFGSIVFSCRLAGVHDALRVLLYLCFLHFLSKFSLGQVHLSLLLFVLTEPLEVL